MKNRKVKQVLSGVGTSVGGDIRKGCEDEYSGNTMYSCMNMEK
jgi:hypothetical protein